MDPNTILTSIGTTLITNLVSDKNSGPLRTLNDVWDYSIGSLIHSIAEKRRVKHAMDVEAYKKQLEQEVLSIPPEHLVEPSLNILGPALEASKYYIEEESLRSMFAKLVASSMDDRKSDNVHPAFIEVIKQLSPLEAEIIGSFKGEDRWQPIVNFGFWNSSDNTFGDIWLENVYLRGEDPRSSKQSSSITNLERLGLISISYDFDSTSLQALQLQKDFDKFEELDLYRGFVEGYSEHAKRWRKIAGYQKGIARRTPFGGLFLGSVS
ncbi:DUF4393 domain-containing protein [Mesobacillus foraminis]|uniref:DUF4393 domain-containing protein n=1 Tax=Mesobacillus foraminis TaxID=279826 RepID=UPI0013CE5C58|nr:DUF4393 domain-containing protein [Mesobacillus foraminis]